MIEQPDTANDLFSVFSFKHRGEELNAAQWVTDFMRELHCHFAHRSEPLQPNPLATLAFEIFSEDANTVLQVAIGFFQGL